MATEDAEERAAWLAALRAAYGPGGDEAGRAALLAHLLAGLTPAARTRLRDRWRAWAFDLPVAGQALTSADAQRFEALLPALLAATLDPAGADYAWMQDYLEGERAARDEVAELQQALDDERTARQTAETAPPRPFPAYDLAFLTEPSPGGGVPAAWAVPIQVVLEQATEAGQRGLRLLFGPRPASAPAPPWGVAEEALIYDPQPDDAQPGEPPRPWTTLLAQTVDRGSVPGQPRQIRLLVQVQPRTRHTCHLRVRLSGPGVEGQEGATRLWVEPPGGPVQVVVPDAQGEARLVVALDRLSDLTITIVFPGPAGSG